MIAFAFYSGQKEFRQLVKQFADERDLSEALLEMAEELVPQSATTAPTADEWWAAVNSLEAKGTHSFPVGSGIHLVIGLAKS